MDSIIKKILEFKKEDIPSYEKYLMIGGGTPGVNLVKGEGVYAYDIDGKKYIDCTSQSWALHLGYSHPEINQAVKEQDFIPFLDIYLQKKLLNYFQKR